MEQWKAIAGFEGRYEVSDEGRVRSLDRYVMSGRGGLRPLKGQIIVPEVLTSNRSSATYLKVKLCKNSKHYHRQVHRLVAEAFIPNPENKPQVNHLKRPKTNNAVNNLEWATKAEDEAYALANEEKARGSKQGSAKLNTKDVLMIRKRYANGESQYKLANDFDISRSQIGNIVNRKNWAWAQDQRGFALLLEMLIVLCIVLILAAGIVPSLVSASQMKTEGNVEATLQNVTNAELKSFTTNLAALGVENGSYDYSINGNASAWSVFAVPSSTTKGRLGFCSGNVVPATVGQVQQFPLSEQNL